MANPSAFVEAWPTEELLAAIMTAGVQPASKRRLCATARELAVDLLADLGGLGGLARTTENELEAHLAGVGPPLSRPDCARAIVASFELGRRLARRAPAPVSIASSADVATWGMSRLAPLDHEELWLLALDGRSHVRAVRCVAKGGLHGMGVQPADPLRLALRAAASGFVLVHNHPSGDPAPSSEDVTFTCRVAAAAAVVGMPLLDHVVVARGGFASVPFPAKPGAELALASAVVEA